MENPSATLNALPVKMHVYILLQLPGSDVHESDYEDMTEKPVIFDDLMSCINYVFDLYGDEEIRDIENTTKNTTTQVIYDCDDSLNRVIIIKA